jgi:predicted DNA-binding ribbon-helix-helix protein
MSVRLPNWLHKQLRQCAQREGISINQLISSAAAEKLAALMTEEYLEARAKRASRKKFAAALKTVPDVEPDPSDRLLNKSMQRRRPPVSDR